MKHIFLFLVAMTMTCQQIETCFMCPIVYRCENEEVFCYFFHRGGASCKWKESK